MSWATTDDGSLENLQYALSLASQNPEFLTSDELQELFHRASYIHYQTASLIMQASGLCSWTDMNYNEYQFAAEAFPSMDMNYNDYQFAAEAFPGTNMNYNDYQFAVEAFPSTAELHQRHVAAEAFPSTDMTFNDYQFAAGAFPGTAEPQQRHAVFPWQRLFFSVLAKDDLQRASVLSSFSPLKSILADARKALCCASISEDQDQNQDQDQGQDQLSEEEAEIAWLRGAVTSYVIVTQAISSDDPDAAAKATLPALKDVIVWRAVQIVGISSRDAFIDIIFRASNGQLGLEKVKILFCQAYEMALGGTEGAFISKNAKEQILRGKKRPRKRTATEASKEVQRHGDAI